VRRPSGLCKYKGSNAILYYNRALSLYLKQFFASLPEPTRNKTLRRAADWASSQGDLVSAGNLAALAGDRQGIVEYVTRAGGMRIQIIKGLDDVRALVTAAGEAFFAVEPRLKLLKCFLLLKDGQLKEAMHLYQEAAQALPSDDETQRGADYVRVSLMVYGCHLATMNDTEVELAASSLNQDPVYRATAPTILAMMHSQHAEFQPRPPQSRSREHTAGKQV
jgi:LuxR family maltose regulon positive regulatory protein